MTRSEAIQQAVQSELAIRAGELDADPDLKTVTIEVVLDQHWHTPFRVFFSKKCQKELARGHPKE